MSFDPNKIGDPNLVDKVLFRTHPTPGLCDITGISSPRKWEVLGPAGISWATLIYKGRESVKFSVACRLVDSQDWADWYKFKPFIETLPTYFSSKGVDIHHPLINDAGITSVVVEDIIYPIQVDDGLWVVEFKLIENRDPKPGLSKPAGSEATPSDPNEQTIARKTAENAALQKTLAALMAKPNNK